MTGEKPIEVPKKERNDQWKRGGICAMCRRQPYCKTQCSANRNYAHLRIREYIRRRTGIAAMRARMSNLTHGAYGHEYEEE
jgi:hypothetical protein